MALKIGTFRKNLMRVRSSQVKDAKLAMKLVSRNTNRTNILNTVLSLNTNIGLLVEVCEQYILGEDFKRVDAGNLRSVMALVGGDIVLLAKILDVKTPTASKRIKLVGTRTHGLLTLATQGYALLAEARMLTNTIPVKFEDKEVNLPKKGVKEIRPVRVVDAEALEQSFIALTAQMSATLSSMVQTYWRLSFDLFGHAPEDLFTTINDQLIVAHGAEFFAPKAKIGGQAPGGETNKLKSKSKGNSKATVAA